jgi:hypothetical protein
MADNPDAPATRPGIKIAAGSSEQAPFIYFDGVSCFGTNSGTIQIEFTREHSDAGGPRGQS